MITIPFSYFFLITYFLIGKNNRANEPKVGSFQSHTVESRDSNIMNKKARDRSRSVNPNNNKKYGDGNNDYDNDITNCKSII
jgi:hypothetical protein